jgi:hypothetical protein
MLLDTRAKLSLLNKANFDTRDAFLAARKALTDQESEYSEAKKVLGHKADVYRKDSLEAKRLRRLERKKGTESVVIAALPHQVQAVDMSRPHAVQRPQADISRPHPVERLQANVPRPQTVDKPRAIERPQASTAERPQDYRSRPQSMSFLQAVDRSHDAMPRQHAVERPNPPVYKKVANLPPPAVPKPPARVMGEIVRAVRANNQPASLTDQLREICKEMNLKTWTLLYGENAPWPKEEVSFVFI